MCKVVSLMLFILIATTFASDSNSSLLESKIKIGYPYRAQGEKVPFPDINYVYYDYVISIGTLLDGNFIHMCLGSLISPLFAISTSICGDEKKWKNEVELSNQNVLKRIPLYVLTSYTDYMHQQPPNKYEKMYFVEKFLRLYDYMSNSFDNKKGKTKFSDPEIALIKLDKKVQFKSKKPEFAQFHFEHGTGSYSVVGWNDMESSGMGKALVKIPGFVGNPNQYEDGFYINLCTPKYDLTYRDMGALVFLEDTLVGMLVEHNYLLLVKKVSYFNKLIEKLKDQESHASTSFSKGKP